MIYSLDTNIIIELLRSNPVVKRHVQRVYNEGNHITIPLVVYYEVVRGFTDKTSRKKIELFHTIYADSVKFPTDEPVMEKAAEIYKELCTTGKKIEDADIFIAAATLVSDAVLVTDNVKHFARIPNLRIVNWKEDF